MICNTSVTFSSSGNEDRKANFDYAIFSNLSDGGVIVKADISRALTVFNSMVTQLAAPQMESARNERRLADDARADFLEKAWAKNNPDEVSRIRSEESTKMPEGRFSATEKASIYRASIVSRQCEISQDEDKRIICQRLKDITPVQGVCESMDGYMSTYFHCNSSEELQADNQMRLDSLSGDDQGEAADEGEDTWDW